MTVVGSFWNGMKTQTPSETVKHLANTKHSLFILEQHVSPPAL